MTNYDEILGRKEEDGKLGDPWKGYYLTAYSIAVKHGFEGTESQWLASLKGPKGDDGHGIEIKGSYDTEEELNAAHPTGEQGDAYLVGAALNLYTWENGWKNNGSIVGPVGPQGIPGETGPAGQDGAPGEAGKDGVGIAEVTQTTTSSADGGENVITVKKTDGSTSTFTVRNGNRGSEGPTGKDGAPGEAGKDGEDAPEITDISINSDYHLIIKLSDGSNYDAGYCRGASGSGTGDMQASTYDPQGKNRDIFAYVDEQTANIDPDVTADEVTFADGETFQEKYDKGELTGPIGPAGKDGAAGKDGDDGVGIQSVEQTTTSAEDGGENVITVTKTDGSTSTFKVKNGSKGSDGAAGYTPVKGVDYFDGQPGKDGEDGTDGSDGVGIESVTQTTTSTADGGENVITVKKTDGSTSTFSVKNGNKGSDGAPGATGPAGSATQYTGTVLSTGWTESATGYMAQGISIPGLVSNYNIPPDIDVVLSLSDLDADKELIEAFGLISAAITGTDVLSVYCVGSTPSINVPIVLRVWE